MALLVLTRHLRRYVARSATCACSMRFETEYAWAEDPLSRTRSFVANVRAAPGGGDGEVAVRSNLPLFHARGEADPYRVSCERRDTLRRSGVRLLLARRLVLLDHTWLPAESLGVFL